MSSSHQKPIGRRVVGRTIFVKDKCVGTYPSNWTTGRIIDADPKRYRSLCTDHRPPTIINHINVETGVRSEPVKRGKTLKPIEDSAEKETTRSSEKPAENRNYEQKKPEKSRKRSRTPKSVEFINEESNSSSESPVKKKSTSQNKEKQELREEMSQRQMKSVVKKVEQPKTIEDYGKKLLKKSEVDNIDAIKVSAKKKIISLDEYINKKKTMPLKVDRQIRPYVSSSQKEETRKEIERIVIKTSQPETKIEKKETEKVQETTTAPTLQISLEQDLFLSEDEFNCSD